MSVTAFNAITRSALWNAYYNKCFYCEEPLDWLELEIDHIIPEYLQDDPGKLHQVIIDYELGSTFDLNAMENLVPAHARCNLKKGDQLLPKTTIHFYFGLTRAKKVMVEKEIEKITHRKNKGQIISKLQTALSTKLIDVKELESILLIAQQADWNNKEIKIPHGVQFIDEVFDAFYLNADYSKLYDKKLLIGGVFDSLTVANDAGETMEVSTLREWQDAEQKGFRTRDNAHFKMSFEFILLERLLEALSKAKMPKVSFISEPWIDIYNPDYLSPNILYDVEGHLKDYIAKGASIGDMIREGVAVKTASDYYGISIEYGGMETSISEQFRADFNDDGIEDIFVQGWTRAIGGTLGFGTTMILTRRSSKGLLEEVH